MADSAWRPDAGTRADWEKLVSKQLGGASPDTLDTLTHEGFDAGKGIRERQRRGVLGRVERLQHDALGRQGVQRVGRSATELLADEPFPIRTRARIGTPGRTSAAFRPERPPRPRSRALATSRRRLAPHPRVRRGSRAPRADSKTSRFRRWPPASKARVRAAPAGRGSCRAPPLPCRAQASAAPLPGRPSRGRPSSRRCAPSRTARTARAHDA